MFKAKKICLPLKGAGVLMFKHFIFYWRVLFWGVPSVGILHIHIHNKLKYVEIKDMGIR